eukprot:TRINITY_DN11508_c0_g1_i1.p1 TRINITY_DN11508_c0_g1~~TRINITY_DN11508_c0_g1_i1.p1  ORF type:complete len:509 (-),score=108.55 TRINITY_DN11508_c0_g1_i1:61-1386(-)
MRQAPWYGETRLERVPALSYTSVHIGTPSQVFKVQVDTGSADLVIPGSNCRTCADDHRFLINQSCTARVPQSCWVQGRLGPCPFSIQYGDGTRVKGLLLRERLAFDVNGSQALGSMVYMDLMLQAEPAGVFSSMGINGILGLGFDTITSNHMPSPLTFIMEQQGLDDLFAMYVGCEVGGSDGVLTIGGYDHRHFKGPLQYTPIVQKSYYCVEATGLSIGRDVVVQDSDAFGIAFVDSGTTFTLLPEAAFASIRTYLQTNFCHLPLVCDAKDKPGMTMFDNYCLVGLSLPDGYPTFRWDFRGGVQVHVPPEAYFRKIPYEEGGAFMYCFGLGPMKSDPPSTILGDTFMVAAYVVFDRRNMRIGFGKPTRSTFRGTVPPPRPPGWPVSGPTILAFLLLSVCTVGLCCYAEENGDRFAGPPPEDTPLDPVGQPPLYGTGTPAAP